MTKTKVLLDSNALFMPFQFGINLESQLSQLLGDCDIIVPSSVAHEIASLSKEKYARAAERLCAKYKKISCGNTPSVDECVAELAERLQAVIVTADKNLQKMAISRGCRVAALRGKNHLVILPIGKR